MLSCLKYFLIERLLTSKRGRRPSSGTFMLDHRRRSQRSIRRRMRGFLINAKRSPAASRRALRSKSTTTNSAMRGFLLSVLRRTSPLSTLSNRKTRSFGIIHPPFAIECRRITTTAPEAKVGAPRHRTPAVRRLLGLHLRAGAPAQPRGASHQSVSTRSVSTRSVVLIFTKALAEFRDMRTYYARVYGSGSDGGSDMEWVVLLVVVGLVGAVLIRSGIRIVWALLTNAIIGLVLIFLTNLFLSPPIPINLLTILISAIGGVIGWLIILILHLLGVAFV